MNENKTDNEIEIRVFGALRKYLDNQGIPYFIKKQLPSFACTPFDIAKELSLPKNEIEGVFINGKISAMDTALCAGDRIAFLPYGTPGPYRVYLGIKNK